MNEETQTFIKDQIEGLAGMVKSGFDHVEERFGEVERSLEQLRTDITDRFEKTDSRLNHLSNRLDAFVSHERRIKRLEREAGLPAAD